MENKGENLTAYCGRIATHGFIFLITRPKFDHLIDL